MWDYTILKKNNAKYFKILAAIFYAPRSFIQLINKYRNYSLILQRNYMLRMVSNFQKNNMCFVKFQIINTRATFDTEISSVLVSKKLLIQIDPFHLFELGYLYKNNQDMALKYIKEESKFKLKIQRWISKLSFGFVKKIKEYPIRIENFQLVNDHAILSLRVVATSLNFEIPLNELIKDFSLLSNIEPGDLVRIGYSVREEEIKKNIGISII